MLESLQSRWICFLFQKPLVTVRINVTPPASCISASLERRPQAYLVAAGAIDYKDLLWQRRVVIDSVSTTKQY